MELVDIYDENRNKTGKVKDRHKDVLENGEYALVVGSLLINSKRELLISKRSMDKKSYPGFWEFIGGGSITGENSEDAIIREISEEIGIHYNKNDGILVKTVKTDCFFKDLWAFKINKDIKELKLDPKEVAEVKWADIDTVLKLREDGKMIESNMITKEDFRRCLKLLKIV